MRIEDIVLRKIFDSGGKPTIEVELSCEGVRAMAQIPTGKSRGKNEAAVKEYADAKRILDGEVKKEIIGKDFKSIGELDKFLIVLDGTENKSRLGGNLILGISVAFTKALAASNKKEVWEVLRDEFFAGAPETKPFDKAQDKLVIFSNLINGGEHAANNLNIQEYLVLMTARASFVESIGKLTDFYFKLGDILRKKSGKKILAIGAEGGYSLDFKNNFDPLDMLGGLIKKPGLSGELALGLDCAATNFYKLSHLSAKHSERWEGKGKNYVFDKKKMTSDKLLAEYLEFFKKSKLLASIEDPFAETDYDGFKKLKKAAEDKIIVGDDLTTTNAASIKMFADNGLISGVIIKPNQIGTVTETCAAMNMAREKGIKSIVSHRSGETEDIFIVHLAKAGGAYGLKMGAPVRERIFKFNEVIR